MSKQRNTQIAYGAAHRAAAEQRRKFQMNSFVLIDYISVEGKTYPVISFFMRNEPETAYKKLQEFLK